MNYHKKYTSLHITQLLPYQAMLPCTHIYHTIIGPTGKVTHLCTQINVNHNNRRWQFYIYRLVLVIIITLPLNFDLILANSLLILFLSASRDLPKNERTHKPAHMYKHINTNGHQKLCIKTFKHITCLRKVSQRQTLVTAVMCMCIYMSIILTQKEQKRYFCYCCEYNDIMSEEVT